MHFATPSFHFDINAILLGRKVVIRMNDADFAAAVLSVDDIVKMCDELIEAHGDYLPVYN